MGTVHDAASLRAALRLADARAAPEWLEIRLDGLIPPREAWAKLGKRPLLLTARDSAEGGRGTLPAAGRAALVLSHLVWATAVDIELRNWRGMRELVTKARAARCRLIASFHDFDGTPARRRLVTLARHAQEAGADIFKVATTTNDASELARLLAFISEAPLPVAVMGMGRFGRVSRLVLAQAGSALNYVSIAKGNAPGQWPARIFRERVAELGS